MRVLVTGGTGFLGAYVVRHLAHRLGPDQVVALDQHADPPRLGPFRDAVTLLNGDITDFQFLMKTMTTHDITAIAHLAAAPGPPAPSRILPYSELQCLGTAKVFEAARQCGIRRLVTASSVAVLGRDDGTSADENAPLRLNNLYAASKAWGEVLAQTFNDLHDMEIVSLRVCPSWGYGRLTRRSLAAGLLPAGHEAHYTTLPEVAAVGSPIVMPPNDQIVDLLFAQDAARAWGVALLAEALTHRVYNLRGDQRPMGDVTEALRRLLPEAEISVAKEFVSAPRLMNNRRLIEDFGFAPTTLEAGLSAYIQEVQEAGRIGSPD